jgi:hypothetical protein
VPTAPKEPVVPESDKPERYDELTAPEKLAPDTPKKIRKARSIGQRRRRMHRKRDARRARDRCQKLKAREELAARESKAREELATREELAKSEARQAREQHETWKKRDESRASDQACQLAEILPKDLPRPETVDWSPTFKVGDINRARVTDERATHVLLLFAAIDTSMPPLLGIALCASILRSTPHAPYLRGAAPRVFGKATPKAKTKEEKDSEQVKEPKPHFPPNSCSSHHISRSWRYRYTASDPWKAACLGKIKDAIESYRCAHTMAIVPRENRSPWYYASLQRLQRLQCRKPAGPIEAKCHEQPLPTDRRNTARTRRRRRPLPSHASAGG